MLDINLTKCFNPIVPLYFCVYKNKRYIIDGQHRLNCYKNNENLLNKEIPIIDIYINNEDEKDYYIRSMGSMHMFKYMEKNNYKKIF